MADLQANNESKNEGAVPAMVPQEQKAESPAIDVSKTIAELKETIAKRLDENKAAEESKKAEPAENGNQNLAEIGSKITQLETQLQAAEVQLEALRSGLKTQFLEDAVIIAGARKAKGGAEYKTIFAELKSKYPMWFADNGEGALAGQKGTGTAVKAGTVAEKADGIGARLAKRQKAQNSKSFWKN